MAKLTGTLITDDFQMRAHLTGLLRTSGVAVSVLEERRGSATPASDLFIIDVRGDAAGAAAAIQRVRGAAPAATIFAIAQSAEPDAILHAMRAGANEFFAWPPQDAPFHEAVGRAAARAQAAGGGRKRAAVLVFLGAKGGVGTTTMAVNTAVDLARAGERSTLVIDLKPGLGEVGLFLGMRCRYTLLDAMDNLHRMDEDFVRELLARHKSGLDVLAGSEQFDRPAAPDAPAIEEVIRLLSDHYQHIVIDAGTQLTAATMATLYGADAICLVANPDVASVRNTQRLLERIRQLGPGADRIRVLLNRAAEPFPIPPAQIEAALGHPIHQMFPSDYKTVAAALNAGVPIALAGNSELAREFERFTRSFLDSQGGRGDGAPVRKSPLRLQRLASLW